MHLINRMTIFYKIDNKLYINLTNACPCACVFCIRFLADSVADTDSLWLEREPTLEEAQDAFLTQDLTHITEIIFCGYGEPMERADDVIALALFMRKHTDLPFRLNTNGLGQLLHPEFDMKQLSVMDTISISLYTTDADEYHEITKPKFGDISFDAMLNFAKTANQYTHVVFTVLDNQSDETIKKCQDMANHLGISLRIRAFV